MEQNSSQRVEADKISKNGSGSKPKAWLAIIFPVFSVMYFISPIDVIPDVIPIFGWIDDILVNALAVFFLFRTAKNNSAFPAALKSLGILAAIILVVFVAYSSLVKTPIEKVKNTVLDGQKGTVEEGINLLAGTQGKIEWKTFESEKSPGNDIVEITVTKPDTLKVEYKKARFQYTVRKDNGFVQMSYMEFNGKPDSLIMGALKLQIMMTESATGK